MILVFFQYLFLSNRLFLPITWKVVLCTFFRSKLWIRTWTYLQVFVDTSTRVSKGWIFSMQSAPWLSLTLVHNFPHWNTRMTVCVSTTSTHSIVSASIRCTQNIDLFWAAVYRQLLAFTTDSSKTSFCKKRKREQNTLDLFMRDFLIVQLSVTR